MKKNYEPPTVEKIAFRYRDQVVAASGGGGNSPDQSGGNIFQSSEFGNCYSVGDAIEYLFATWLGQCDWL